MTLNAKATIVTLLAAVFMLTSVASAEDYSLTQYLNIQYARLPDFSPGGLELMYVTNVSGVAQVWRIPCLGGYPVQMTFDTNGVDRAWWCPADPTLVAVSAAMGGSERSQLYLTNPMGGPWKRVTESDQAIYAFGCWSRDGRRFAYATNERNQKDFDIFEYSIQDGGKKLLYQAEGSNAAVAYSPDARYLLIERTISSAASDLLLCDRESGKTRLLNRRSGQAIHTAPTWNESGTGFYLLSDERRDFTGLAYWPLDGSAFRWIETPEWDVEQFVISDNGRYLAWTVNEDGYSRFHLRDLERGREVGPSRVPLGVIEDMVFSADGFRLAFTFGTADRPYDLWLYEVPLDKMHQITYSATGGIPLSYLRAPQLIEYPSFDGRSIPAFWYTPAQSQGKMPVIVSIHGGPEGQARPDMSGLYQFLLSRGYAVLEPNVRGSTGYGKTYEQMDNVRKRPDAVRDVEFAAQWLKARPDVDPTKLIIYGGSYGGYMSLASLTSYPETWAAGVSVVGIANFVTFLENTGAYRRALREAEYGTLAADREFLTGISPLTHAGKIKAPLFIIQGANDPRVPQSESDQIAAAVRGHGGVVEYLLFPDEGHGLRKTRNRITAYSKMIEFLDANVLKK